MGFLRSIIRPLVPQLIIQKYREAKVYRETQIWQDLDLHRELAGLSVRVSSKSDWVVFNEVFVERIYDRAIAHAWSHCPKHRMLNVVDLGANVGYFALRLAQKVLESDNPDRPFTIYCVEGSPRVYADLSARIAANPHLKGHVQIRNGLVGKRFGSTAIYESSFGAGNSTIPQHWSEPVTVSYIDLDTLIPNAESIALLKCDIEGSEQLFQDNYHCLLLRTQAAVVELHHPHIDDEKFHEGMTMLGFSQREVLWESEREKNSLILYKRSVNQLTS